MVSRNEYQTLDDGDGQFSTEIQSKITWDHIQNLDKFFSNVYYFHQQNGFYVTFIEFILQIMKFFSIIWIISILVDLCFVNFQVVKNDTLIYEHFYDPIIFRSKNVFTSFFVCVGLILLFLFIIVSIPKLKQFYSISKFYRYALKISDDQIPDITWAEILLALEDIQKELQLCVHKPLLTTLDIYQRILRRQNYLIAFINHDVVPVQLTVPFIGDFVIVTKYYLDSLKFLLFKFPFRCPFGDHWQLRSEYKNLSQSTALANQLRRILIVMGVIQLVASPFCFLYLLITKACTYGHGLRMNPGHFVSREITPYGRLHLSHYNELPHEFIYRISKAYPSANMYLDSFLSKIVVSVSRLFRFLSGGLILIGFCISMVHSRFLITPHVITIGAVTTAVYALASKLIPDESAVVNPQMLMLEVLSHVHYIPDHWKDTAHTRKTYNEFAKLFQPRAISIVKELASCFWTPLLFMLWLPHHTHKLVNFLRNFTTEVNGIGDVCSFALMEVNKHGSAAWSMAVPGTSSRPSGGIGGSGSGAGRIEMSLLNFHTNNPECALGGSGQRHFVQEVLRQSLLVQQPPASRHLNPYLSLAGPLSVHQHQQQQRQQQQHQHQQHQQHAPPLKNANKVVGPAVSFLQSQDGTCFSNYFHQPHQYQHQSHMTSSNSTDPNSLMQLLAPPHADAWRSQMWPATSLTAPSSSLGAGAAAVDVNMAIFHLHSVHEQRRKQYQQHQQPVLAAGTATRLDSVITEVEQENTISLPLAPQP